MEQHHIHERLFMRPFSFLALLSFLCALGVQCTAQEWPASPDQEYHEAIVEVISGNCKGTGTVVRFLRFTDKYPDYYVALILTASHVVQDADDPITIKFNSGVATTGGKVVKKLPYVYDGFNDLCVIKALVPKSVAPMPLYDGEEIKPNTPVEMAGFGHADGFRHWNAPYAGDIHNQDGHVIFSWGIQGDSGGPVIYKGEVIGVICYGSGLKQHKGTARLEVGPIYSSNVGRIKKFIMEYPKD